MAIRINTGISIRRKRLVRRMSVADWLLLVLLEMPFRFFFIAIFSVSCWEVVKDPSAAVGTKIFAALVASVGIIWFLVCLWMTGVLVEIGEIRNGVDCAKLEKILQQVHSDIHMRCDATFRMHTQVGFGFDNRLIILLAQGHAYINFATLGRGDYVVYSMGIINYYRALWVQRRFREYLTKLG